MTATLASFAAECIITVHADARLYRLAAWRWRSPRLVSVPYLASRSGCVASCADCRPFRDEGRSRLEGAANGSLSKLSDGDRPM